MSQRFGYLAAMAYRTVGRHAIPGIVWLFFLFVVVVVAIIALAWIVHWAGCSSGSDRSLATWRYLAAWRYLATRQAWAGCFA